MLTDLPCSRSQGIVLSADTDRVLDGRRAWMRHRLLDASRSWPRPMSQRWRMRFDRLAACDPSRLIRMDPGTGGTWLAFIDQHLFDASIRLPEIECL